MNIKNLDKTLLVLDIDETLIYGTETELDRESDFKVFEYFIYKRPYLSEFINGVKEDFLLGIWSSASDDYVKTIAQNLFPNLDELAFVWGRSRCSFKRNFQLDGSGYYDDNYLNHYNYVKPLKKLKRQGFALNRILIVDDTPHKSQNNYGNAIYPKEYKGEKNDNELKYLLEYLKLLKDKENVRTIEKRGWRLKIEHKLKHL